MTKGMRGYALVLILFVAIGVLLAYLFFKQEQKFDKSTRLQTTASIRNLQSHEKSLRFLLIQSRLNPNFDYASLRAARSDIIAEFDMFRFGVLFEEIEKKARLSEAFNQYEDKIQFIDKVLERYIDQNIDLTQNTAQIQRLIDILQTQGWTKEQPSLQESLSQNKSLLFNLALTDQLARELWHKAPAGDIPDSLKQDLNDYENSIKSFTKIYMPASELYNQLIELDTVELLDDIESAYNTQHNEAIADSSAIGTALVLYGLASLMALMYFGYQIRRNYLSLEQQVSDRTREITVAYEELQESQEQLIQSEKMASLGQMVAGVAHEINTPLGYVTSNIDTLKLNLDDFSSIIYGVENLLETIKNSPKDGHQGTVTNTLTTMLKNYQRVQALTVLQESKELLGDGAYGLAEISKLVSNLRDFSRLDRQSTEHIDLHECLEVSLKIASPHIRDHNVELERHYVVLPKISCIPSKLNQLFLNIITNACQAMESGSGILKIETRLGQGKVKIVFTDNGIGMDETMKQKMFDPFYTSKEIGKGTGLGMSIAFKIVAAHGGNIKVDSKQGVGTEISVILPIELNENQLQ